jgi:hypothetical protein
VRIPIFAPLSLVAKLAIAEPLSATDALYPPDAANTDMASGLGSAQMRLSVVMPALFVRVIFEVIIALCFASIIGLRPRFIFAVRYIELMLAQPENNSVDTVISIIFFIINSMKE